MQKTLLSIIIPTKNRAEYAFCSVKQILELNLPNVEVVVQDNGTNNELHKLLTPYLSDNRLVYNYTIEILSFVDNFNLSISNSSGKYLCLIGDDDGITPEIITIVKWADINNIDAVKTGLSVYFWPNSGLLKTDNGVLKVYSINKSNKFVNARKELEKLFKSGCQNYLDLDLAKIYHGIVKKSCFDPIINKTGKYIGGLSPDINSVVALSLNVKTLYSISYPVTICGICPTSGSADSAKGKHTGLLKDAPHFNGHNNYEWSSLVPEFYCVETIWADSALAAINDLEEKTFLKYFHQEVLIAYCLIRHPEYRKYSMKCYFENNVSQFKLILTLKLFYGMLIYLEHFLKKVFKYFIHKGKRVSIYENLIDISMAEKSLSNHLRDCVLPLEKILINIQINHQKNIKI